MGLLVGIKPTAMYGLDPAIYAMGFGGASQDTSNVVELTVTFPIPLLSGKMSYMVLPCNPIKESCDNCVIKDKSAGVWLKVADTSLPPYVLSQLLY